MQNDINSVPSRNFVLNETKIHAAMKDKGFGSIEALASALGVHRNTILPYLSGDRALPDCLDRMLKILDLSPGEAITKNIKSRHQPGLEISALMSSLVKLAPENAYILFGSRARGNFRKHSDYDIGVYNIGGLPFTEFSKLIDLAEEWEETKHYDVNLTNLTLSDSNFLLEVRADWIYLGGSLEAWIELQKQAGISLYE